MADQFPVITAFLGKALGELVTERSNDLIRRFPKMSKAEADAVAASRINLAYAKEFEQVYEQRRAGGLTTYLHDEIVSSGRRIGEELQDLTGTRTILADEGITDEYLEETYNPKGVK